MIRLLVFLIVVFALGLGFAWLAWGRGLGIDRAWAAGVGPFLAGAVVKNLLGALLVPMLRRWTGRPTLSAGNP